jgi:Smg protein
MLTQDARGFLIRLRSMGLLDNLTQEEVIDRAFQLGEETVSIKEVKVITALTLFARTNEDWRREVDCLLAEDWSRLFN